MTSSLIVLSFVKKTVTVGVESRKIIASLPPLKYNIDEQPLAVVNQTEQHFENIIPMVEIVKK